MPSLSCFSFRFVSFMSIYYLVADFVFLPNFSSPEFQVLFTKKTLFIIKHFLPQAWFQREIIQSEE
uniref:Macaca fascicularis brain cDNA, clone: QorA-10773 n=1 Tax=Macaca fascicularis TaxID=9541 RepID=I7G969_MACFA|nr:unnamed protein product [Macaca fascicularis]